MALPHTVYGASGLRGVALLEGVTKRNTLVPDGLAHPLSTDHWKGRDQSFDEYFDYLLELENVGVFHVNQELLVYRHNLIITISDEAWDRLEDPDIQKWLRKWVPLRTIITLGSSVF